MEDAPFVTAAVRRLTVNLDTDDTPLFKGQWVVPNGVALHCYLISGSRLVLVDPWDDGGYGPEEIGADLKELGLSWADIAAVAFTLAPAADLIERIRSFHPGVADWGLPQPGARHDVGGVWLEEKAGYWALSDGTAFTGEALAGLGWVEDELWTEDLGETEARYFEDEALRWFVGRPLVPQLPVGCRVVAPLHGCLWKDPSGAVARARQFDAWATDGGVDEVTLVWPADDDTGADALVGGALDADAGVNLFRLPGDDIMALTAAARRSNLIVVPEGLDDGFLRGLTKTVWRPPVSTSPDDLRQGLVQRWKEGA